MTVREKPTVLVLEDEPVLMLSLVDLVEQADCAAVEVADTATAIALLERRADIRVVLTDLDVRGSIMGMRLVTLIRDRWPPIELILTSSAPTPPPLVDMPARSIYLGKPFDGPELIKAITAFVAETKAP